LFFAMVIFIVTSAVLELIFAPLVSLKYYIPSLFRTTDPFVALFYVVCILVQAFNLLASICLFASVLFTGYSEKWCAYDTMSLVSVALSFSLIAHHQLTGADIYRNNVEKDIYLKVASI